MRTKQAWICIWVILLISVTVASALAGGSRVPSSFKEYTLQQRAADLKILYVPMSERLCALGYLGNSKPATTSSGGTVRMLPDSYFAAMNFFAQVMGLDYVDGVISEEAQAALFSSNAKKSPIPTPDYNAKQLSSVSDTTQNCPVYEYITLTSVKKAGNTYTLTGIIVNSKHSDRSVSIQYAKPVSLPEIYAGDDVVVIGTLRKYDKASTCYMIDAQLVAFPADH